MMTPSIRMSSLAALAVLGVAVLAVGWSSAARAAPDPTQASASQSIPKSWNWEIRDGKRVPKADRQSNADGSWREVTKQGTCTTVKERSPAGEYKETRSCD